MGIYETGFTNHELIFMIRDSVLVRNLSNPKQHYHLHQWRHLKFAHLSSQMKLRYFTRHSFVAFMSHLCREQKALNRKVMAMTSDAVYNISCETIRPWKHTAVGLVLGTFTGSKLVFRILNCLGHSWLSFPNCSFTGSTRNFTPT